MASKATYEEIRKKRLDENKKRMEELNLKSLSKDLRPTARKPSMVKQTKPNISRFPIEFIPVRRSSRVADKPPISYKEFIAEPQDRSKRSHSYQRKDLLNRVYASDEIRAYAIHKAEQLQSELDGDFPSLVKPMLQSHVTGGFWLGLPLHFCKVHLPKCDEMITLVDENGEEHETKYLGEKTGLSAGWRGFAVSHELVDGDALVFQLIAPTKFKVYIIRAYGSDDNGSEDKENKQENAKESTKYDTKDAQKASKRVRTRR